MIFISMFQLKRFKQERFFDYIKDSFYPNFFVNSLTFLNQVNPSSPALPNASRAVGGWGGVLCPLLPDWPKLQWKNIFIYFLKLFNVLGKFNFFSSVSYDLRVEIPVKRPHPLKADRVKSKPKKWKIVKKSDISYPPFVEGT